MSDIVAKIKKTVFFKPAALFSKLCDAGFFFSSFLWFRRPGRTICMAACVVYPILVVAVYRAYRSFAKADSTDRYADSLYLFRDLDSCTRWYV